MHSTQHDAVKKRKRKDEWKDRLFLPISDDDKGCMLYFVRVKGGGENPYKSTMGMGLWNIFNNMAHYGDTKYLHEPTGNVIEIETRSYRFSTKEDASIARRMLLESSGAGFPVTFLESDIMNETPKRLDCSMMKREMDRMRRKRRGDREEGEGRSDGLRKRKRRRRKGRREPISDEPKRGSTDEDEKRKTEARERFSRKGYGERR